MFPNLSPPKPRAHSSIDWMNTGLRVGIDAPMDLKVKVWTIWLVGKDKIKTFMNFLLMYYRNRSYNINKSVLCYIKISTFDLTETYNYDPMSVYNTDEEEIAVTRATIETDEPSIQPVTATLSLLSSTPITASTYALSPSTELPVLVTRAPI